MTVVLAATYHDPEDRLYVQTARILPVLIRLFSRVVIDVSDQVSQRTVSLLVDAGVVVRRRDPGAVVGFAQVGKARRSVLRDALQLGLPFILYGDGDRVLHWAEYYPEELAEALSRLVTHDCTVFGRTERAFATHPRVQRDTESIINHVFATVSGYTWDVTGAARGLSRAAAAALVAGSLDDSIGTDASWPLLLQRAGGFSFGYQATEGLEFETADRYSDAITASGGREHWMNQLDEDPSSWALRLDVARIEVEAMQLYWMPRRTLRDE